MSGFLETIVQRRRERVRARGHAMGAKLPERRRVPIVPFGLAPFLICEIKRGSPSKGPIAADADAVAQAHRYAACGALTLSVLTEEDYFSGSLEDLRRVKEAFPRLCVLRKDFILDAEDIEASHRAGADAVLLIARLHDAPALARLAGKAKELGLAALLEVHDPADLEKARSLRPAFTGFNSRDLSTFAIDPVGALRLLGNVDWRTTPVYESGIGSVEDARFALSAGFSGILAGEALMRDPSLAAGFSAAFLEPRRDFWPRLYGRQREGRPLVKICGLTRGDDALLAARLGADVLGFVFAQSPRRANPGFVKELDRSACRDRDGFRALTVGVVAGRAGGSPEARAGRLDPEIEELLEAGALDAVQLHGDEEPEDCALVAWPHYKALRIGREEDVGRAARYGGPRVLADAWARGALGGTGAAIPESLVLRMKKLRPLWLAGGLGPGNVRETIGRFGPELVDASSRLETSPGAKDPAKLELFFEEVNRASGVQ